MVISLVATAALAGCTAASTRTGDADAHRASAGVSDADATENSVATAGSADVVVLPGAFPPGPESVADLRAESVVIATVTGSELGPATGPDDDILYPHYVTLAVEDQLGTPADLPEEIVLWAQYVDDDGQQYVSEGRPWLDVGDRVLTTIMPDDSEPDLYGIRGLWTTYEIVDGHLSLPEQAVEAAGGREHLPPLADEMLAMTEEQAVEALGR